jgi:hypothetical protein
MKEGGSIIAVATEISLELDNKIEPQFVIGSKTTILPAIGRSDAKGTATFHFTDGAQMLKFVNDTPSNFEMTMPDGAGNVIGLRLPLTKYTGGQSDVSGEGPTTIVMPFQGIFDPVTNTNIIIKRKPAAV